jgi:hypothetical protein
MRRHVRTFLQYLKAETAHGIAQQVPARLDTLIVRQIGVMVQERPHVDPKAARTQYLPDLFDVRQRIASRVQKETRTNAMPTIELAVNVNEVAGNHTELHAGRKCLWTHVGKANSTQRRTVSEIVDRLMHPRIHCVSVDRRTFVQNEIGGEQHEQRVLVALTREASSSDFERKSSESGAGYEHVHFGRLIAGEQSFNFTQNRLKTFFSFVFSLARPFANCASVGVGKERVKLDGRVFTDRFESTSAYRFVSGSSESFRDPPAKVDFRSCRLPIDSIHFQKCLRHRRFVASLLR